MIEEAQVVFHKADGPDFIADFLDADFLAGEDGAEVDLSAADADAAALRDGDGSIMERALKLAHRACGHHVNGRREWRLIGLCKGMRDARTAPGRWYSTSGDSSSANSIDTAEALYEERERGKVLGRMGEFL